MPRGGPSPDGASDESLADLFWSAGNQLRGARRASLAPYDISPSQSRALVVLARHGTMRQRGMSDHLRIAPRSTTEVVDALEERGLVERRTDPSDRRATLVALTDEGSKIVRAMRKLRAAETDAVFGRLDAREQQTLRTLLRKLAADPPSREQ